MQDQEIWAIQRRQWLGMLVGATMFGGLSVQRGMGAAIMAKGKVLMPIGDATEAMDTLYPYFRVAEDDYLPVVAGPEVRKYHMVLHEVPPNSPIPWDITEERPGYHIQADIAFRDVDPNDYVALFVSGGRAPEYLRYDQDLLRITRQFAEQQKPIAVVCHGIEILSAAGVINGKHVTTVAKCALDCTQGGGRYSDQPVVVDGNIVSARTWHDNAPFMRTFMQLLNKTTGAPVAVKSPNDN